MHRMHEYMDDPEAVESWLETLTEPERTLFDKGYVECIHGLLEQFTDMKTKLLNKMMDEDNEPGYRKQLASRVHILDVLEKHYKSRADRLEQALPA